MLSKKTTQKLYEQGAKIRTSSFTLVWSLAKNKINDINLVIAVPKKNMKKAVDRNYTKRRIKEAYKKCVVKLSLKSVNIILIYTKSSLPEFNKLREELLTLFQILGNRINESN